MTKLGSSLILKAYFLLPCFRYLTLNPLITSYQIQHSALKLHCTEQSLLAQSCSQIVILARPYHPSLLC